MVIFVQFVLQKGRPTLTSSFILGKDNKLKKPHIIAAKIEMKGVSINHENADEICTIERHSFARGMTCLHDKNAGGLW